MYIFGATLKFTTFFTIIVAYLGGNALNYHRGRYYDSNFAELFFLKIASNHF